MWTLQVSLWYLHLAMQFFKRSFDHYIFLLVFDLDYDFCVILLWYFLSDLITIEFFSFQGLPGEPGAIGPQGIRGLPVSLK